MTQVVVSCGALAIHVKQIAARRGWDVDVRPVPPELHNRPERIRAAVEEAANGDDVVVAYAHCGADLAGFDRLAGAHCYEVYGAEHEPATYFLTDFLVRSFDRVVWRGLGLDRHPELRDDYFRNYERCVWLAQEPTAGAARRRGARGRTPATAARGARDWCHRARTRTGEAPVLINEMPRYEILDEFALQELERGWRRIVSDLGIEFLYEEALEVFRAAGQNVEGELVKFDPDWILEQVAKAPPEFDLQARNSERTVHIGGKHMVFSAVYGCPFVREGLERRDATYDDFQNFVKLAQSFPQLDSPGGTICEPNDLPLDSRHLDMVFALTTLSDKPFMGSVTSGPNARDTIAMAEMIFGKESIEKTPAIISLINVNSPLRYDDRMLSALIEYAKAGQATVVTPFLLMGAMSPVSVAATLAQQVAEALAGIALVQTIRPGCPVVFGSFLSNTDMQSGSPAFGTPESAVGLFCTGQIARHYNLPFRGGGALTSSQVVDAQAGYESMMSLWPTFLAGTNFVMHSAGLARVGARLLLREVRHRRRDAADAARGVPAARDQRGDARVLGAPGGGAGRPLPRRRAHARALPRVLLPAARVVDRELRALEPERRPRHGHARDRHLEEDARGVREAADRARARGGVEGVRRPQAYRARRLTWRR